MRPPNPADQPLDGPARGEDFLALLRRTRCLALMNGVRDAPLERNELIAHVGFEGSAFDRPLRMLTGMGLIVRMVMPDDHRRTGYHLARCGADLLALDAALQTTAAGFEVQGKIGKALLAETISDPWDRAIIRVLLEARQQLSDLSVMAHGPWRPTGTSHRSQLSEAALRRRLDRLCALGLVEHQLERALYGPGRNVWRLGRIAALAASWRWRWTPENVPRMAGDLEGLMRMIAPRVQLPQEREIRVVLHVSAPPGRDGWPDAVVSVIEGRTSVSAATLQTPDAHAYATPEVWLQAFLSGNLDAIEIEGERAAAHAVLPAVSEILRA